MAEVWTPPAFDDISTTELVTAAQLNAFGNSLRFLEQVAYAETNSDVTATATSVGTANTIITSGALTYDSGTLYKLEFQCGYVAIPQNTNIIMRDVTTVLGTLTRPAAATGDGPIHINRYFTVSAGSHTINVAAWLGSAGTTTFNAGSGGTAGNDTTDFPLFIAIYRIPT